MKNVYHLFFFIYLFFEFAILLPAQDFDLLQFNKLSAITPELDNTLSALDAFGSSVCTIGDLNNDGYQDIAVGAFHDDDNGFQRGALYILFMEEDGTTIKGYQKIDEQEGNFNYPLLDDAIFGVGCTNMGDLDQDGITDLAVGAAYADDGGSNFGQLYILFLNTDGTVKNAQKISATAGGVDPGSFTPWSAFGRRMTNMGDMNGDGINDLAVGGYTDQEGGEQLKGAVWILFLNTDGTVKETHKINDLHGNFPFPLSYGDNFGTDLTNIGDLNQDGINDLIVCARLDDEAGEDKGALYVLLMSDNGTVFSAQKVIPGEGGLTGLENLDRGFGSAIAALGDVNGDGNNDIAVASFRDDDVVENGGAIWIIPLEADGSPQSHYKISASTSGFTGQLDPEDFFGFSIAGLSNPQTGSLQIGAGAPNDDDGAENSGALWILEIKTTELSKAEDSMAEATLVSLFPNPAKSHLNINWRADYVGHCSIRIFNISGKEIFQQHLFKADQYYSQRINIQHYPTGLYFLQINTGFQIITSRFIHQPERNP